MLVRGFYYEGWSPAGTPIKERRKEEFCAHVQASFKKEADIDAETIVRAVFKVLAKRITEGDIEDIKHILPPELRELWPSSFAIDTRTTDSAGARYAVSLVAYMQLDRYRGCN